MRRPASISPLRALGLSLLATAMACSDGPGPTESTPSIALSAASVEFSVMAGSGPPAARVVAVTSGGNGSLNGLSASVSYGNGQGSGWLSATLDATSTPASLSIEAAPSSLAPGSYSATVTLSSAVAGVASRTVEVSLTVSPAPAIALSVTNVGFDAQTGGAQTAPQEVSVTSGGGGTLSGLSGTIGYLQGQPNGWLSASLSSTSAPATLTLRATPGSLPAGTYRALVVLSAPGAANRDVDVELRLSAPPSTTYTLSISALPADGGTIARTPSQSSYTGGTVVSLTATPRTGWRFTAWSGALVSTTNPASVTMDANKSVAANFALKPPVMTASASGTTVTLSWTYDWPCGSSGCLGSSGDHYIVEQSTTSATSGFAAVQTTPAGVHTNPYVLTLTRAAGTYHFRVRAATMFGGSEYSQVRTVVITGPSEITVLPSHDNLLLYSTTDDGARNRVYQSGEIGVGCNWAIGAFVSDWLCASSALRFDGLQAQIAGRTIVKATLRLHPYLLPADRNTTYAVNAFVAAWSPSQITFANQPNYYVSGQANHSPPVTTSLPMELDVTTIVRNWANGQWSNNGLLLRDVNFVLPSSTAYRITGIESLEYNAGAARRPRLHIQFQ